MFSRKFPIHSSFNIMWKTFTDDCQFFDSFPHFALLFSDFNLYFCVTALGKNVIPLCAKK